MKLINSITLSLTLILTLSLVFVQSSKSKRSTSKSGTQYWIRPLIKTAKSYLSFANLAYCKPEVINALSCPLCSSILDASFKVLDIQGADYSQQTYRYVAMKSESHKEVVISFSGPKSTEGKYYSGIYTSGWGKFHGERVEKAYLNVYNKIFGKALQQTVKTLNSNLHGYKIIFVGHSFGGSLAVLAAFDLMRLNILTESPLVYSYGQLRIGDNQFVERVNSLFKVVRIVKNSDFMTRLPNCQWSQHLGEWKCYKNTKNLMEKFPETKQYIMHYGRHNGVNQHYAGLQAVYGSRSFLEKSARGRQGYQYSTNNPGYKSFSYGSSLTNLGAKGYGNIQYSQPMGAEIIFSDSFTKSQVCSYFNGIPNCEKQLPDRFSPEGHANYYGENVEEC